MKKFCPGLVPILLLVVFAIGCSSPVPTLIPTPTPIVGPVVRISFNTQRGSLFEILGPSDDERGGQYGFGRVTTATPALGALELGYFVPQQIEIQGVSGWASGKSFQIFFGPGELPVNPKIVIRMPLTKEMQIGPLREGLTQVLFYVAPYQ